jgi:hypothetical protein
MKSKTADLKTRLNFTGGFVLLVGLGSALLIYLQAERASENALVADFLDSKRYRHDLELYGGNVTVIADDFCRWFDGLWHGEALAGTIACLAVAMALGIFFVARHMPAGTEPEFHDEK